MTPPRQGIAALWEDTPPLVGMVHLLPLPGAPGWRGSMSDVLGRAGDDARTLAGAGFDGICVENFLDAPFYSERVPPETVAALCLAVSHVRALVDVPVGVNVLRNDAAAALGIAAATGAGFIRVNVHTGAMWTDQGLVVGRAHETLRLRRALGSDARILADVHVKHATPPAGADIAEAARDCWYRGLADALVVSGSGTGEAAGADELRRVRSAVPEAPLLVGSGLTPENAAELLACADGAIVGSSVMEGGPASSWRRPGASRPPSSWRPSPPTAGARSSCGSPPPPWARGRSERPGWAR